MSHTPPVPAGSVSPYPLKSAEASARDEARHELAEKATPPVEAGSAPWGKIAAGSAIGSAAIAAALIFWNRSKN